MLNRDLQFTLSFDSPDTNGYVSSGNWVEVLLAYLTASDFLYTFGFRYPRLSADFQRIHGGTTTSQGYAIDFTHDHGLFAVIVTVVILGAGVGNAVTTSRTIDRTKQRNSTKSMYQAFAGKASTISVEDLTNELNDAINAALVADKRLEKNKQLYSQYNSIAVQAVISSEDGTFTGLTVAVNKVNKPVTRQEQVEEAAKTAFRVGDTASDSLGLVSYAYWILYIGVGAITKIFDVGVAGITPWVGFGVPLLAGLSYGGYKLVNYIRNKDAHIEERNVFNTLAENVAIENEVKAAKALDPNAALEPAPESKKVALPGLSTSSIVTAGVFGLVGTYIGWQYNMWYVSDVLLNVFHVALTGASEAIGVGIFVTAAISGIRAVYNAYESYQKSPAKNEGQGFFAYLYNDLKPDTKGDLLKQQQNNVVQLELEVARLSKNCHNKGEGLSPVIDARLQQIRDYEEGSKTSSWKQSIRNFLHVGNFGMSGVFVIRTIAVKGTTSFLLPGLGAALVLSNPWTIGLLVGAGIVWGAWKYYNYRKAKNIMKIDQANQHIELLEKKIAILKCHQQPRLANSLVLGQSADNSQGGISVSPRLVVTQAEAVSQQSPRRFFDPSSPKRTVAIHDELPAPQSAAVGVRG